MDSRAGVIGYSLFIFFLLVLPGCGGSSGSRSSDVVPPAIRTQPSNTAVVAGQTATFTVVVSGSSPMAYQWKKNDSAITGATSASYTTPATTSADDGSTFKVVVSNAAGSATSNPATLTVSVSLVSPSITQQPSDMTVTSGQTATFTVVVSGSSPMVY